jgi:hypothetical protein
MASISDKLSDVKWRIVESELRIAQLQLDRSTEAVLLVETATAALEELRRHEARLEQWIALRGAR